ncbi:TonB-dependent receptor plug domain-containing protein [Caulobacter segnis]
MSSCGSWPPATLRSPRRCRTHRTPTPARARRSICGAWARTRRSVLIDGRRMPGLPPAGGSAVMVAQADVNALPLAAIDRVEILNATAGGIYGAAAGGAVNIVLQTRLSRRGSGRDLRDHRSRRRHRPASGRAGRLLPDGGRTDVMVAFGLLRGDGLSVGDRDYEAKARALRYRNDPAELLSRATDQRRDQHLQRDRRQSDLRPGLWRRPA